MGTVSTWIYVGANAYLEYVFIPFLNRTFYRRTVDLKHVCLM